MFKHSKHCGRPKDVRQTKHSKQSKDSKDPKKKTKEEKLNYAFPQIFHTYRLVAVATGGSTHHGQQTSYNHTRVYLLLAGHDSVQVDMECARGSNTGRLLFEWKSGVNTPNALKTQDFQMASARRVQDVYEVIRSMNLDEYEFGRHGFGCRYWQWTLLRQLELLGYFVPGANLTALDFLSRRYSNAHGPRKVEITHGSFDYEHMQRRAMAEWLRMREYILTLLQYWQRLKSQYEAEEQRMAVQLSTADDRRTRALLQQAREQNQTSIDTANRTVAFRTFQYNSMGECAAEGQADWDAR